MERWTFFALTLLLAAVALAAGCSSSPVGTATPGASPQQSSEQAPDPSKETLPPWPLTEAEFNASLPGDIHADSRSRIPIANRDHKVRPETFSRALVDLCEFMGNFTRTAILLHTVNVHLPYDRQPLLPVR